MIVDIEGFLKHRFKKDYPNKVFVKSACLEWLIEKYEKDMKEFGKHHYNCVYKGTAMNSTPCSCGLLDARGYL